MPALTYPFGLPCPRAAALVPKDRIRRSDLPGAMQFAGFERDFSAQQDTTFVFSAAQAATFYTWWRDSLSRGGQWFVTDNWPVPAGWSAAVVRRFIGAPTWSALGAGYWSVSSRTELRGRSKLPQVDWSILRTELFLYKSVSLSDTTDYSPPGLDDSTWNEGNGTFGDRPHPISDGWPDPTTIIPVDTSVWLRKHSLLPVVAPIRVTLKSDNGPQLWVNGDSVSLSNLTTWIYEGVYSPSSLELVIALRVDDTGPPGPTNYIYAGLEAEYA